MRLFVSNNTLINRVQIGWVDRLGIDNIYTTAHADETKTYLCLLLPHFLSKITVSIDFGYIV